MQLMETIRNKNIILLLFGILILFINCNKFDYEIPIIKECVITIDDMPRFPENTSKMLDVLQGYPVTCFCIGKDLQEQPELANRIARDFTLSNHTWNHSDIKKSTNKQINSELLKTDSIIRVYNSKYNKQNRYFRCPYGSSNNESLDYIYKLGFNTIWWQLDASDWDNNVSLQQIKEYYVHQLDNFNGTPIILFHLSNNSIEGMKWLLQELNGRNIKVISLQEYLTK